MVTRTAVRRWARTFRPVVLGQMRLGFVVAAAIVLMWQLGQSVKAAENPGSSENDYFRLEWDYNLGAGTGTITFVPKVVPPDGDGQLHLLDVRFTTAGVVFDSMVPDVFDDLNPAGQENGLTVYAYWDWWMHFVPWGDYNNDNPLQIDVTFPTIETQRLQLRDTEMNFRGLLSGVTTFIIPPSTMDFVSIEQQQCGHEGQEYLSGDLNQDCYVNLLDLSILASNWLECNDPANLDCPQE